MSKSWYVKRWARQTFDASSAMSKLNCFKKQEVFAIGSEQPGPAAGWRGRVAIPGEQIQGSTARGGSALRPAARGRSEPSEAGICTHSPCTLTHSPLALLTHIPLAHTLLAHHIPHAHSSLTHSTHLYTLPSLLAHSVLILHLHLFTPHSHLLTHLLSLTLHSLLTPHAHICSLAQISHHSSLTPCTLPHTPLAQSLVLSLAHYHTPHTPCSRTSYSFITHYLLTLCLCSHTPPSNLLLAHTPLTCSLAHCLHSWLPLSPTPHLHYSFTILPHKVLSLAHTPHTSLF